MAPRHDHDAGGDPATLEAKRALREATWDRMVAAGAGRFPVPKGRIPNFVGAEVAAEALRSLEPWRAARTVKSNPDSPQWPVRQRALEDGKVLYMAVPRLAGDEPFFLLDPDDLSEGPRRASSIKGASRHGRTVAVDGLDPVDLVVTGCVAVDATGARLGKGGGFADLEHALAWEAGMIGPDTLVVTTVHETQLVSPGDIPVTDHDFPLDVIVTPDRVIDCREGRSAPRPAPAIHWDELTEDKIDAIPLLARLAREPGR